MKKSIFFVTSTLCIALFVIGCKNADRDHSAAQKDSTGTARTTDTLTRKDALIAALKDLRKTFASPDKQRVATLFQFPVPDSVMIATANDSMFYVAYENNKRLLTDTLFNKYFDKISSSWDLDEFDKVFKYVDVNQLRKKDSLARKVVADGVVRLYELQNKNDSLISMSYGVTHTDSEDGGEYNIWWYFVFDGRRLRVVGQGEAD
ncbi:MAG TPA: hypothetical protein VIM64_10690 [Puia sp.]